MHKRFACVGCAARRGELTFFNDYHSAASHYARSSLCNTSMRGIKTVAVQLNTCPQHVGDGDSLARPEEVEHLAPGGPNPRHLAAQVP